MAEPIVWGLLPKAQDDGTTIDEAITAAIAAHETDPEAHLGTDESIDVHRKNTTIDHPAGSVMGDKLTSSTRNLFFNFESLTGLSVTGGATYYFPGLKLSATTGARTAQVDNSGSSYIVFPFLPDNFPFFQAALFYDDDSRAGTGYFGLGGDPDLEYSNFIGFKLDGNDLYGYIYDGTDSHSVALEWDNDWLWLLRVYVDPVTHDAVFLVNGVEKGRIVAADYYDAILASGATDVLFTIKAYLPGSGAMLYLMSSVMIGQNVGA